MTKYLNGRDLADFIKARQATQVRSLKQIQKITPKLCIFVNSENPVIDTYVRLKQSYGEDIGVAVDVKYCPNSTEELIAEIKKTNDDPTVHGIIVQLPIHDTSDTDEVVSAIVSHKDVDGLSKKNDFDSATAVAINWLLTGYNIDLKNKQIAIVGAGRLVGGPLYKMWSDSLLDVSLFDKKTAELRQELISKDIIVTGAGCPGLITSEMVKNGAVVVDAGTTSEGGTIRGDVSSELYDRQDITITPTKGGVGPLTVTALFDHVIQAADSQRLQN